MPETTAVQPANHHRSASGRWSGYRAALRSRRARRHEIAALDAELAAYTSAADLLELDAIARRSDSVELSNAVDRVRGRQHGLRYAGL